MERGRFVRDFASGDWTMTDLCEHYGVSRPTGYKWVERYADKGEEGLEDLSRVPLHCPHRTTPATEELVVLLKRTHGWGARKILRQLRSQFEPSVLPCRSTVFDILKRHGLVQSRRRRHRWLHPGAAPLRTDAPNQVWTIDFKGQFRTRDGQYCYPLTVMDHFSRYLLCCYGLPDVKTAGTRATVERLFRECGLPDAIRSDNGVPFASTGIHGLCELNVWWIKLGIVHQRITPSSPQENGAHERMHRTMKAKTTRPPAANRRGQQWKFDDFRREYNVVRPHEALNDETPASLWLPSPRPYPVRILAPEYPGHFEVRRVSNAGHFIINGCHRYLSQALNGEYIGIEPIDDGIWNIIYYATLLGRLDERAGTVTGASYRSERCK
jgi:putative transposase